MDSKTPRIISLFIVFLIAYAGLPACQLHQQADPPAIARTAFLADTSRSAAGETMEGICLAAFDRITAHAADTRGSVTVETMDGNALANSRTPIDVRFAVPGAISNNPVYANPILQQQRTTALTQLEALFRTGPTTHGTDVLGALDLAERILTRPPLGTEPEQRFLVVCSDLFNSLPPVDFYGPALSPADIERTIKELDEAGRLPFGFDGVRVYLVAAGQPTKGEVSPEQIQSVEMFFRRYFEAVSAEVVTYAATLPNFP